MALERGIGTVAKVLMVWTSGSAERAQFQEALRQSPVEVSPHFAQSDEDLLQNAPKRKPSAIMIDWNVVPADQIAIVLQKLRANPFLVLTPIFFLLSDPPDASVLAIAAEYGLRGVLFFSALNQSIPSVLNEVAVDAVKPSSMRTLLNKIEVAVSRKNIGELDMAALDLYTLFPNETRAQVEYANLLIRRADWTKAKEIAAKVLAKEKNNLRAKNVMVRILLREKKFDEASALIAEAEDLSPGNVNRMVLLGDLYRERGNNEDARRKYDEALSVLPEHREAKQGVALVELSEGDINTALTLFRETSTQEEIGSFFNDAAIVAVRRRNLDDALSLYNSALTALEKSQLRARIHFNTGLAFYKFSRNDEAVVHFKRAAEADPEFSRARDALSRMGREDGASSISASFAVPEGSPVSTQIDANGSFLDEELSGEETIRDSASKDGGKLISEPEEGWAPWNAPVPVVSAAGAKPVANKEKGGSEKKKGAKSGKEDAMPAFMLDDDN